MSRNAICKKKLVLELLPISFGTKNRQNLFSDVLAILFSIIVSFLSL
jgi:hypothetical protein